MRNYFFQEIGTIAIGSCHMETQEERVIKHHRWLLLLQEQAVLLIKKRIEERNRYLACK